MTLDGGQRSVLTCRCLDSAYAAGFTLVELLVGLAVAAILLGVAAPQFRQVVADSQLTSRYNEIPRVLRLARSEAISRAADVVICARASERRCGTSWNAGWLVFVEDPAGTAGSLDAGETILQDLLFDGAGQTLSATAIIGMNSKASTSSLSFGPRGRANWTVGTLVVCDGRGAKAAKALVVNGSGNFRQAYTSSTATDTVTDAAGNPVVCP